MHVLIWILWGCESRPQPGSPVVFVKTEQSSNTLSQEIVQAQDSSQDEKPSEDNKSSDDLFSDSSFELSSDQMNNKNVAAMKDSKIQAANVASDYEEPADFVQEEAIEDSSSDEVGSNPLESISMPFVLVDLLETVPPRAVLRLPSGEEMVAKAGMLIPKYNVVVLAVGTNSATLVKISGAGDTSNMEPLNLTPLY